MMKSDIVVMKVMMVIGTVKTEVNMMTFSITTVVLIGPPPLFPPPPFPPPPHQRQW